MFGDSVTGEDVRNRDSEGGYSTSCDGTGFDLSIVDRIVESHDRKISVTDRANGDTRFEPTFRE